MKDPTATFVSSLIAFGASIISVIAAVAHALAIVFTSTWMLIILLVVTAVMVPIVKEGDVAVEEIERFMRGTAVPAYRNTVRVIINFLRRLFNSTICPIDGINWISYGLVQDAIYPTILECNPSQMFINLGDFVVAVLEDFVVNYFLAEKFFNQPCDFTNICNKWINFWEAWIILYKCTCSDLGTILESLPIIPSFFFSAQWSDPQTWCVIGNATNAIMELLSVVLTLVSQLLLAIYNLINPQSPYAQANFVRPDFYKTVDLLCSAGVCLMRSTENALQRFWDNYIPFNFVFANYLCILDRAFCFILKTINWILTFLINIDRVVQYPTNPFWNTIMKPLTIENLNIIGVLSAWAPVPTVGGSNFTMTNYALGKFFFSQREKKLTYGFARHKQSFYSTWNTESNVWKKTLY